MPIIGPIESISVRWFDTARIARREPVSNKSDSEQLGSAGANPIPAAKEVRPPPPAPPGTVERDATVEITHVDITPLLMNARAVQIMQAIEELVGKRAR